MSDQQPLNPDEMTEEQLRAAYEAEIKKVRVEHVLLENVVTVINLGMRRTGMMPGTEDERDPQQVQLAVESVRTQLPLVEAIAPEQAEPLRQALSQLQMAYVQITGGQPGADPESAAPGGDPAAPGAPADAPGTEPTPGEQPGPAQSSGRLWVPGQ
jgi:hypothetical protein